MEIMGRTEPKVDVAVVVAHDDGHQRQVGSEAEAHAHQAHHEHNLLTVQRRKSTLARHTTHKHTHSHTHTTHTTHTLTYSHTRQRKEKQDLCRGGRMCNAVREAHEDGEHHKVEQQSERQQLVPRELELLTGAYVRVR
jgi:hypothetical protein